MSNPINVELDLYYYYVRMKLLYNKFQINITKYRRLGDIKYTTRFITSKYHKHGMKFISDNIHI